MPPRKKPTSTKQKKADQQLKRAIKRGDVPPPEPTKKPSRKKKGRVGPTGMRVGESASNEANIESVKRLQSAFVKVSAQFLEETKVLASNLPLTRPIPNEKAIFPVFHSESSDNDTPLRCMGRPKWRFDMTKVEVEANEEGMFKKWLAESDTLVEGWRTRLDERRLEGEESMKTSMPPSITHYERNLEVWRQLWRVGEISQMLLVLLDSRCPTLHFPPALSAFVEKTKVILVLTKVDISGPARVEAWKTFLRSKYPGLPIVEVESYVEKQASAVHQGKRQFEPSIPLAFRQKLIQAIQEVHNELVEPPEWAKRDPVRMKTWVPAVKRDINWTALLEATGDLVGLHVSNTDGPRPEMDEAIPDESSQPSTRKEPEFLTIGLIGQPNVGKSSLLNALFGARKVRASKTPGKTKHFQTLFWTKDVRLVDCPGLVVPNYVPMEMQVLAGVLPISRVSAVMSCIHYAAELLPLERILQLEHPSLSEGAVEDKRTWRAGMRPPTEKNNATFKWTAADILTAYANAKGWLTAKAGRPDVHRAGNAILRSLAEGRIHWAFWPPGSELKDNDGTGIWIPHEIIDSDVGSEREEDDLESDDDRVDTDPQSEGESGTESEEEVNTGPTKQHVPGRFSALAPVEDDDSDDSEE